MSWWELPLLLAGVLAIRFVTTKFDVSKWLARASWALMGLYCVLTAQWIMILLMVCWYVYITEVQDAPPDFEEDVLSSDVMTEYPGIPVDDDKSGGLT